MQQSEPLGFQRVGQEIYARSVSARPVVARRETGFDRIAHGKDDRIVEVAALAASAADAPPVATRMATERPASSAASGGSRSTCPSAHLYSIATFWPST